MDSPPPKLPHAPSYPVPAEQYRNWLDLPLEVTESILKRLSLIEILTSAQKVCLLWRKICKSPSMWHTLNFGPAFKDSCRVDFSYDIKELCRHAVDLSCGQLVGIKVGSFCSDSLLKYITESSSELKYLGLSSCYDVSDKSLSEAAANVPLLDVLEVSNCTGPSGTENFLKAVGRSCPHLKTLQLRTEVYWEDPFQGCNLLAVAIAENMPELVRLQLHGNKLTDDGLQAILEGCPRLQSLELRHCRHVTLKGDFGRRCSERIKDLQFHYFSDQEFEKILEDSGYYDRYDDYENFWLEYIDN